MAKVDMDIVHIGHQYTAKELAEMWGYKSHHALVKGIVTPSNENIIILFVTKEKQSGATPYKDDLIGNILYMMGQAGHGTDDRLLRNLNMRKDDIYLFYRVRHHTPFVFKGRCFLINAIKKENEPSEFEFLIESIDFGLDSESDILDYFINIPEGDVGTKLLLEGKKSITQHVKYERNPYNRKEAIRIHGCKCRICGFDFDEVYGNELAESYIEIHHIKQLSEGEQFVDPIKDLIPVCANCHRMLHRKKKGNVSISELTNNKKLMKYIELLKNFSLS